MIYIFMQN